MANRDPGEQEKIVREHPDWVRNTDGIPVIVRDGANWRVLDSTIWRLDAHVGELHRRHPDWNPETAPQFAYGQGDTAAADCARVALKEYRNWKESHDLTTAELGKLKSIRDSLKPSAEGNRFLVLLEEKSNRTAVAVNNPDTADDVTTYVPGTGAKSGNIGGEVGRADHMVGAASSAAPGERTSVISWVGYGAPQDVVNTSDPGEDATNIKYAERAAPILRNFQDGLRSTHIGAPPRPVVLGHSYGSTVVGTSAADYGRPLDADSLVLVASPGADGEGGLSGDGQRWY